MSRPDFEITLNDLNSVVFKYQGRELCFLPSELFEAMKKLKESVHGGSVATTAINGEGSSILP